MTPQTRRSAKSSPGRSTRNSMYGRSPLPLTKPRKSSTDAFPAKPVPAQENQVHGKVNPNAGNAKSIPWLACRDPHGVPASVSVSETGEGVHVRWYYPDDEYEVIEEEAEMTTTVDDERDSTPQPTAAAAPSKGARLPFPQTPMAPQPYDAGSVIRTPVKKAKPLQPSPARIGDKGIRCLYQKDGVLRDFGGVARVVLRHPVGSAANLTREQVERLENEREEKIVQVQVEKLLAERRQREEESSDTTSAYEEMETDDLPLQRRFQREGTNDTILISHSDLSDVYSREGTESASVVFRGPNGELLDHHGRQVLGSGGTILIDPSHAPPRRALGQKDFPASPGIEDRPNFDHCTGEVNGARRPRFGPEGTELID